MPSPSVHCKKKSRIIYPFRVFESATSHKPFLTACETFQKPFPKEFLNGYFILINPVIYPYEGYMKGYLRIINGKRVCYTLHFQKPF
jgi:hypothetical protein